MSTKPAYTVKDFIKMKDKLKGQFEYLQALETALRRNSSLAKELNEAVFAVNSSYEHADCATKISDIRSDAYARVSDMDELIGMVPVPEELLKYLGVKYAR